jgi:hypothetical protein
MLNIYCMKYLKEYKDFGFYPEINEQEDLWGKFKSTIINFFSTKPKAKDPKSNTAKTLDVISGPHMLYLPHQQGPTGAAKIIRIAKGLDKLDSQLRSNLLNNMPQSDPGYATVKTGKDKEAVIAFLRYQKDTWSKLQQEAIKEINNPKNAKVKKALYSVKPSNFPSNFLTTVAYKESRFDPDPKTNRNYRGLFQIGDSAWNQLKKIDPDKYKGPRAPKSPKANAQAGHDYLKWAYDQFQKSSI